MYIYGNKLLISSYNEQCFRQNLWRKSKRMLYAEELFFRKSCRLWDNAGKCCTAGQDTGHNITQCMRFVCRINRQEYRHTLRICNTCCFSRQQWLSEHVSVLRYSILSVSFFFQFIYRNYPLHVSGYQALFYSSLASCSGNSFFRVFCTARLPP